MSYNILCPLTQIHRSPRDDHFGSSHQQWLTLVEVRGWGFEKGYFLLLPD